MHTVRLQTVEMIKGEFVPFVTYSPHDTTEMNASAVVYFYELLTLTLDGGVLSASGLRKSGVITPLSHTSAYRGACLRTMGTTLPLTYLFCLHWYLRPWRLLYLSYHSYFQPRWWRKGQFLKRCIVSPYLRGECFIIDRSVVLPMRHPPDSEAQQNDPEFIALLINKVLLE